MMVFQMIILTKHLCVPKPEALTASDNEEHSLIGRVKNSELRPEIFRWFSSGLKHGAGGQA